MIKLVVCDLDGTLLNSNQELSAFNAHMLKKAQSLGMEYMIATGRNNKLIRPFMEKYDLKCGCILMNGAEVRDKEENILSTINVDKAIIQSLHQDLIKEGYLPFYTTNDGVYYEGPDEKLRVGIGYRQQCLDRKCRNIPLDDAIRIGMETPYAKGLIKVESLQEFNDETIEIRKIVVFHTDVEKNATMINVLETKYPNLAIAGSYPEDIEINDIQAQKGYGLEKAVAVLGIEKDEVAVFGDGLNDASMFKVFPNSYAPENSVPYIKEMAHEIIPSNDNDGVGKKIEELLKENEEN